MAVSLNTDPSIVTANNIQQFIERITQGLANQGVAVGDLIAIILVLSVVLALLVLGYGMIGKTTNFNFLGRKK